MNDADSKKLKEVEKRVYGRDCEKAYDKLLADKKLLISKVKEQEQEIEQLGADLKTSDELWGQAENREAVAVLRAEKAEAQLADFKVAHAAYGVEAERQIDEQQAEIERLGKARKSDCVGWFWRKQTGKAEAELSACKERVRELEDARYQSFKETREHCAKWQEDRKELMINLPGYEYKNRVDDPEWKKAKKVIFKALEAQEQSKEDEG